MWGYDWAVLVAAFVVAVVSAARLTRLVVDDHWPPMVWFRGVWDRAWGNSPWVTLVECPFCVAPYFAAAIVAWAALSDLHWTWWAFNGWLTVSYLASMLNVRDIPAEERA